MLSKIEMDQHNGNHTILHGIILHEHVRVLRVFEWEAGGFRQRFICITHKK